MLYNILYPTYTCYITFVFYTIHTHIIKTHCIYTIHIHIIKTHCICTIHTHIFKTSRSLDIGSIASLEFTTHGLVFH